MTGITGCAKAGDLDHFCESVRKFAGAVCGLTENSAQVHNFIEISPENVNLKCLCIN